jgi:hypothetical protein
VSLALRTAIMTRLGGVGAITGRVYGAIFPQRLPATPAACVSVVSGSEDLLHDGPSGMEDLRIQVTIASTTVASVEGVRDGVKAQLHGWVPTGIGGWCQHSGEFDYFDEETRLHHKAMDFRILTNG